MLLRAFLVLLWPVLAGAEIFAHELAAPLTRALDVRALSPERAAQKPEVRLRGVVTFRTKGNFVLQDDSAALWVNPSAVPGKEMPAASRETMDQLKVGNVVEVEGEVDPSGFCPNALATVVRIVGSTPLPPAPPLVQEDLFTTLDLTERRRAEGTVIEVGRVGKNGLVKLRSNIGLFLVEIPDHPSVGKLKLMGADISVEGVTGVIFNARGEFIATRILTCHEGLRVLRSPPDDPFASPKVPLARLGAASLMPDRKQRHTEGTVTFCQGRYLVLQDGPVAVRVRKAAPAQLFPVGARVEVSGLLDYSHSALGLTAAQVRQVGSGPEPQAVELSPALLRQAYAPVATGGRAEPCDYDGRLVWLEGSLLSAIRDRASNGLWRLLLSKDGELVTAQLSLAGEAETSVRAVLKSLRRGSMLRLTGIADISFPGTGREGALVYDNIPRNFRVTLRTVDDIAVLKPGPWWTPARFRLALAVVLTVALGALIRVVELRRTVHRQALRIEESLTAHRNAELEHLAAREERLRMAADLHDGVQQHLTGASYRMEAALMRLGDSPESAKEQLTAAQAALERTRTELRACMVSLHELEDGPAELPVLLRRTLDHSDLWPPGKLHLRVEGEPFPLSRRVIGSLLLFVQEAVTNAFKHAEPSRVEVAIRYRPGALELEVWDDGKGFQEGSVGTSAGGGLGLETMRHRLRWLGGRARIVSQAGEGTRVIGQLPRAAAQTEDGTSAHAPARTAHGSPLLQAPPPIEE